MIGKLDASRDQGVAGHTQKLQVLQNNVKGKVEAIRGLFEPEKDDK